MVLAQDCTRCRRDLHASSPVYNCDSISSYLTSCILIDTWYVTRSVLLLLLFYSCYMKNMNYVLLNNRICFMILTNLQFCKLIPSCETTTNAEFEDSFEKAQRQEGENK